jgi:nucleoside-diphosphate kinase
MTTTTTSNKRSMTLAILKPDVTSTYQEESVLNRISMEGFRVVAFRRGRAAARTWEEFYAEHAGRPFFRSLVEFMSSGPVVVLALERQPSLGVTPDPLDAVAYWRRLLGATDPRVAEHGTLRRIFGDLTGTAIWRNVAHGSATLEEAKRELLFWFSADELRGDRQIGNAATTVNTPRRWMFQSADIAPSHGRQSGAPMQGVYFPETNVFVCDSGVVDAGVPEVIREHLVWIDVAPELPAPTRPDSADLASVFAAKDGP